MNAETLERIEDALARMAGYGARDSTELLPSVGMTGNPKCGLRLRHVRELLEVAREDLRGGVCSEI